LPGEFYIAWDEKKERLVREQFGVAEDGIQRKKRRPVDAGASWGTEFCAPTKRSMSIGGVGRVEGDGFAVGIGDGDAMCAGADGGSHDG
jgi:hypothetical protein